MCRATHLVCTLLAATVFYSFSSYIAFWPVPALRPLRKTAVGVSAAISTRIIVNIVNNTNDQRQQYRVGGSTPPRPFCKGPRPL